MFDLNSLNRCMNIQNLEEGFIEMEQFFICIVKQSVFLPRNLAKVTQKALRIIVLIALRQPATYASLDSTQQRLDNDR